MNQGVWSLLPNRRNILCGCLCKHLGVKTSHFNENILTLFLDKRLKEEKKCLLMGELNAIFLDIKNKSKILQFYDVVSSHFFAPYILQPTKIEKF